MRWSAETASFLHHITLGGSSFEDIEPIHKMYHKVAGERVGSRITDIVGCYASVDVAALLQNIIYFETECTVFLLEQGLLQRCIPQPFILLKTVGIT
ncbi:hypothetical protein SDC9_171053 [bioreactor metagenome]|uniref:Uncharacterized protein n=1 Tax=bioreactor metagenome TaxID=1076179 RepID=A0A645GC61_9ZZZZ